ncbi:MAG: phosphoribosylglycinamide formyltransferase [Candidatus Poseidonia sp.]|nr:phosphoribosylglycinamide formyltransferase [Poseidonia sp.]
MTLDSDDGMRKATAEEPLRCAVLLSGSGSGMEALVRAQRSKKLPHQTVLVISNKPDAYGLVRAEELNLDHAVVEQTHNGTQLSREEHEAGVMELLQLHDIELVVLAGYMRLLSSSFVKRLEHRIVNIHPSLLPNFPGAHAHRDVLNSGVTVTGCTVHFVDEGMDTGARLAQAIAPVFADDTEASLAHRVKVEEHRLYPEVLSWIATGRVRFTNQGVEVEGAEDRLVC